MKNISILFFLFTLTPALLFGQSEVFVSDKLEKVWVADGFDVPESVLPVPEKGIMYVSNIAAPNPTQKEGKGFISIVETDGKIKELKWCTGLNSPKGMAISEGKLYVTEVDRIAEIDLKTGKKLKDYPVQGADFLNDIAVDAKGNLYISDSGSKTVYLLKDGKVSTFLKSEEFTRPNGVLVLNNKLILGTGSKIVSIDLASKEIKDLDLDTGVADGIAIISPNAKIYSNWPGTIYYAENGKEKELLFDTRSSETSKTADFGYDDKKQVIYVPTFFDNTVICFLLKL